MYQWRYIRRLLHHHLLQDLRERYHRLHQDQECHLLQDLRERYLHLHQDQECHLL